MTGRRSADDETVRQLRATLKKLEGGGLGAGGNGAPGGSAGVGRRRVGDQTEGGNRSLGESAAGGNRQVDGTSEVGSRPRGEPDGHSPDLRFDDRANDPGAVREDALRLLNARLRSTQELERALRKRNFSPTVITEVLTRFVEVGLLDDAVFAQEFTRYSLGKLRSRSVIATELRQRGVARQHIESALRDIDESAELEVAYQLARKRIRSLTGVNTATAYRRLSSALGRRGFSTQVISQVTRDVLGEMGQGLEN